MAWSSFGARRWAGGWVFLALGMILIALAHQALAAAPRGHEQPGAAGAVRGRPAGSATAVISPTHTLYLPLIARVYPVPPPTASFTAAPGTGLAPLSVAFTNTSTGVYTASLWRLGDGITSTLPSPTHVYTAPGAYTVTLTVTGPGGSDTLTRPHCITVTAPVPPPTADFIAAPGTGLAPLSVAFTNTSTGVYTASLWLLGDGVTSTLPSLTHVYTTPGAYTVTLTVTGPGGSDTLTRPHCITVTAPVPAPTADFTAAPGTGLAPLSVAFTNTSTGVYTASLWLLGDGVTSTLPSPTHVYTAPGAYTVTLTVTGPGGSDTFTRPHCVTVTEVRALWVSRFEWTSPASPATPATIDTIVTKAAAARFNVILFQVRGTADALYDSELEPWSARLNSAGTLGVDPSWDPLAYMVERAHAAGLEVHAYINIYPAWAGESAPPSTTSPTHPFWTWSWWPGTGWGDWRQWDQNGPMLLNTDYLWASPGAPIVTDHIVSVALDIATRYPVDGLHLDYVRYAGAQYSCDPFTQDRCAADCYTPAWADWQRAQVTDLVQRIYQDRPSGVDLSAAVWPVYVDRWGWGTSEGRNDYYQDSQGWTAAGIIDALYPMLYYWDQTRFQTLVRDFQAHAAGRSIMPGIGAGTGDFNEIAARIRIARAARTAGHAIFSYGLLDQKGYWDDLVAPGGPYADE